MAERKYTQMNKYEYLAQLRAGLQELSQEERDAAMNYYEEFFNDAGEENEQAVIASLGTPDALSKSIISDNRKTSDSENISNGFVAPETGRQTSERQRTRWTGGQITLLVVLLVLSSPLWIGVVFGLFGALIGIVFGVFGAAIGIGIGGIVAIVTGVIALFSAPAQGLLGIGVGLVLTGLIPLAFYPLCKLVIKLIICMIKGIGALINKLSGKTGVTEQ